MIGLPFPDIVEAHWAWFGIALLMSTGFAVLWSPKRRKVIGNLRYVAGWWVIVGPALFGAVCVRGGYALALQERGVNGLLAQLAGLVIGFGFILLARGLTWLFPPTAWLLREWRRANREASVFRNAFRPRG